MTTKQLKIQEAYGEYYDMAKNFIDENGYCKMYDAYIKISPNFLEYGMTKEYADKNTDKKLDSNSNLTWRPKSLRGIENNNEWIRIESEDNLPKESGWYDFQVYPQRAYKPNPTYWHNGATKIGWFIETYTHYQIIKTQPPIY